MRRKVLLGVLSVLAILVVVALLGPRVKIDEKVGDIKVPQDVDAFVKKQEARFSDIRPGTDKRIVWANKAKKQQTPVSIVFLHGFSASRQELVPLCDWLARDLGANLFYTRLRGHGRTGKALSQVSVNDWLYDGVEALQIGARLGQRVILVASSTGATLATWLMQRPEARSVGALVFTSPNFAPKDPNARMLLWPWGATIVRLILGKERSWKPKNALQAKYWTWRYPSHTLLPMMGLVSLAKKVDLDAVKTPLFIAYSPKDEVISPKAVKDAFGRFGSPNKKLHAVSEIPGEGNHIIAGNIVSPKRTKLLYKRILSFLRPIFPKEPKGPVSEADTASDKTSAGDGKSDKKGDKKDGAVKGDKKGGGKAGDAANDDKKGEKK